MYRVVKNTKNMYIHVITKNDFYAYLRIISGSIPKFDTVYICLNNLLFLKFSLLPIYCCFMYWFKDVYSLQPTGMFLAILVIGYRKALIPAISILTDLIFFNLRDKYDFKVIFYFFINQYLKYINIDLYVICM